MSFFVHRSMKPSEPGIYVVRVPYIPSGTAFALFNGDRWSCWGSTVERAEVARIGGPEDGYDWKDRPPL